jgi:hypothetical protein
MINTSPGYAFNRARISVTLSQFTVPLLSGIYKAFDGDMVCALVLGEIAHRNVEAWLADHDNPEAPLSDVSQHARVMRPCNALSIARGCGLPRETVRRKIVALIERGWIYRTDEGHIYLSDTVGASFEAQNAQLAADLLATARRLEGLLGSQRMSS